jgi:hypothetical protein
MACTGRDQSHERRQQHYGGGEQGEPFYAVGDPTSEGFKYQSYWFKVRCRLCSDFFQLCPLKKHLLANLTNHLQGLKHAKVVHDSAISSKFVSSALSNGHRGRPRSPMGVSKIKRSCTVGSNAPPLTVSKVRPKLYNRIPILVSCVGATGISIAFITKRCTILKAYFKTLVPVWVGFPSHTLGPW